MWWWWWTSCSICLLLENTREKNIFIYVKYLQIELMVAEDLGRVFDYWGMFLKYLRWVSRESLAVNISLYAHTNTAHCCHITRKLTNFCAYDSGPILYHHHYSSTIVDDAIEYCQYYSCVLYYSYTSYEYST